jgi:hypothetical protein
MTRPNAPQKIRNAFSYLSPLLGGGNLYSLRFTWAFLGQARTFYDTTLVVPTSGGAPTQFYSSIHTNKESKMVSYLCSFLLALGGSGGFWIFARKSKKKPELYCSGGVVMVAFRTPLSQKGVLWSFLFPALGLVNSVQVRMTSTLGSTGQ